MTFKVINGVEVSIGQNYMGEWDISIDEKIIGSTNAYPTKKEIKEFIEDITISCTKCGNDILFDDPGVEICYDCGKELV